MENTIYNLKLHEELNFDEFRVTRVSGGWIYRFWDYTCEDIDNTSSVFVPFNNEFQNNQ